MPPSVDWGVSRALKPGAGPRKEARPGSRLLDESLTFMVLELMEERDGTSTVNGPDVVRISRQPWSGGAGGDQERVHQNGSGETLRHKS